MSARDLDRGMRAVERVRAVRERDSRIGLRQALRERDEHGDRVSHLEGVLAGGTPWQAGAATSFTASRQALLAVGDAIGEAAARLEAADRVAEATRAHWSADKVRLTAVESLLARRAEARRVERAHREAVELDDVAGQLWTRAHHSSLPGPDRPDRTAGPHRPEPEADR